MTESIHARHDAQSATTEHAASEHIESPGARHARSEDWIAMRSGDEVDQRHARDRLIMAYAPLVTQVATRMIGRLPDTVELADLVSYGMFGLIDAVEKFDPDRGYKFETYAGQRVRGAIIDELRAADWVPRSVRSRARTVEHATRALEQTLQRPVSDDDVAAHLGWHTAEVRTVRAQVALSHVAALDGMVAGGHTHEVDAALGSTVPAAANHVEARERRMLLADAIQGVREREQQVLRLYYYQNLTLAQIGTILGVTESRVSQIHSGAVRKLRESLERTGAF